MQVLHGAKTCLFFCLRLCHASPHFSPGGEMIAPQFFEYAPSWRVPYGQAKPVQIRSRRICHKEFYEEAEYRPYLRLSKISCENKGQARTRQSGEKCGLGAL